MDRCTVNWIMVSHADGQIGSLRVIKVEKETEIAIFAAASNIIS